MEELKEKESRASQALLEFIERELGEIPAKIAAGAAMRVAANLAFEIYGYERGAAASRKALHNILNEQPPRAIQ